MFIYAKKIISTIALKMLGWKIQGNIPNHLNKLVMIGVPHTTNWDYFIMVCCSWHFGLKVKWLGKESLFSNIFIRSVTTFLGGIKVERSQSQNAVNKIAETLKANKERFSLVIAPEGTRSKKEGWRSGFFYIAKTAKIPIGLGFVDYPKKIMGVGPILYDLKDIDTTMKIIKEFYKGYIGKHPSKQSPIQIMS